MTTHSLHIFSLLASIAGAIAVLVWRVRETRKPVSARKIIIPPMGMATGFCMFLAPPFRVPWLWALIAFLSGALVRAYPLMRTSRLPRDGDPAPAQRSPPLSAVLILLRAIRLDDPNHLDHVQTAQPIA